jgi:hypothetical protein
MFTQDNLIIVTGSVKQDKTQVIPRDFSNHTEYPPNTRMDSEPQRNEQGYTWATSRAYLDLPTNLERLVYVKMN